MKAAQVHLALNHLPVILPLVGTPLVAIGVLCESSAIRKVGLWLLVLAALAAIPVYLSGKPTENIVKNYPGVSQAAIHQHQDSAWLTLIGLESVGVACLLVLVALRMGKKVSRPIWGALVFLALLCFALLLRTAHLGGEIRHEEIQSEEFLQS